MRDRLTNWIKADLESAGVDLPPVQARTGWWQSFPEIDSEKLIKARQEADLSQSALAKACGVQPSTISRYESRATRYISPAAASVIAAELGVDVKSITK
jgi:DNA-binding XRE family transcriptional regulator